MNSKAFSIIILAVAFFSSCSAQFDSSGCLERKACIFVSANCEEKGNCEKIVSYTTEPDDWVVIELFYNTTYSDTNYAAVGFSEDTQMGEEGVTHCGFGKANEAGVFLSQNEGKRNIPLNFTKKNAAEYVELLQASHTTNSIYCKFRQKIAPDKTAQRAHVPDLNHTYYLLLAYGKTDNYEGEELGIHSLDERSRDFPFFISTPVNIAAWRETQMVPIKQRSNRMLMLVGWMWLVPAAITAARYLREHWSKRMPFGLKIWFHVRLSYIDIRFKLKPLTGDFCPENVLQMFELNFTDNFEIHRTMNSLAVLFVVISVLLIFIGKDWRWTGPAIGRSIQQNLSAGAFHSLIGAIAVGIMTVQLVGALLRCDKGSRYRPIFSWFHRVSGLLAFLLARKLTYH
uniref:DOMON domain-containing protein n=1 Tax=Setaria digitata TaxID=48799 RepID=A0A915PIC6_9BILA